MKLFIGQSDNKKIEVLDYLIRAGHTVTLSELVSITHYSEKTVRSIILSYEENPYLNENRLEINYSKAGKIQSIYIKNTSLIDAAFFYLEKAPLFIMVKELFIQGVLDREKILRQYFMSEATFSRNKAQLKKIFQGFELKLTSGNYIEGSEYKIRNFFFLFFSYSTPKWLFSEVSYETIERSMSANFLDDFHLDPSKKSLVRLLFYICKVRNNQGHLVKRSVDITFKRNSTYERIYQDISNYVDCYYPYFENKIEEIQMIFFFLLRGQMIIPDPYEEGALFISSEHLDSIEESCTFLTKLIMKHFFKDNSGLRSFVYQETFLFLIYIKFNFIDSRLFLYVYDEKKYFSKTAYEQKIYDKVKALLLKMKEQHGDNPFIIKIVQANKEDASVNQFFLMVYSLLSRVEERNPLGIKVYVQNSKVYIADILKSKIKKIFLENIEIAEIYDETVDIFVTDKLYSGGINQTNQVYVPTFSDTYSINMMCLAIEKKIIEKINLDESSLMD